MWSLTGSTTLRPYTSNYFSVFEVYHLDLLPILTSLPGCSFGVSSSDMSDHTFFSSFLLEMPNKSWSLVNYDGVTVEYAAFARLQLPYSFFCTTFTAFCVSIFAIIVITAMKSWLSNMAFSILVTCRGEHVKFSLLRKKQLSISTDLNFCHSSYFKDIEAWISVDWPCLIVHCGLCPWPKRLRRFQSI